jgi:hypothetical protein
MFRWYIKLNGETELIAPGSPRSVRRDRKLLEPLSRHCRQTQFRGTDISTGATHLCLRKARSLAFR